MWWKTRIIMWLMTSLDKNKPYPDWACWIAQDADGSWWAFEVEPLQFHRGWYENEVGRYQKLGKQESAPNWKESLQKL